MKLILASGSPRRRELLGQIGLDFTVEVSETQEDLEETQPELLVGGLSRKKAEAVFAGHREDEEGVLVIGADTVVSLDGQILGKPGNEVKAQEILRRLSGRTHIVYTGVTVIAFPKGAVKPEYHTFAESTQVTFYEMSDEEIREYTATKDPLDKAGAYGIQGLCARYIKEIRGDYNNVVGLPVGALYQTLKKYLKNF